MKNITSILGVLVLSLVFLIASVSADSLSVEVSGVASARQISTFTGDTIPVRVIYDSTTNSQDVRIKVWVSGESENAATTERFDVFSGNTYSRLLAVQMPARSDPNETIKLEVVVESRNDGILIGDTVDMLLQRGSYNVEVLDAILDSSVSAGETIPVDIILKNAGLHSVEDAFVTVRIPTLGVEKKAYFGDLSAVDQDHPTKEDAVERRMLIKIPSDAKAGVYNLEVKAYDYDSSDAIVRRVAVTNGGVTGSVIDVEGNGNINWPLLMTVVLAIIFVVLLVVLIVLLVRRPANGSETKEEDYGESYY
ncbi:MAG: hypothetical protein WCK90_01895 [archaeon]